MSRGFSLVELLLALLILQVGLLATAGTVFLAQRNLARAELVTRGILAARSVADSLGGSVGGGSGALAFPWGEVVWGPGAGSPPGIKVVALSTLPEDTLAVAMAWAPVSDSLTLRPERPWERGRK